MDILNPAYITEQNKLASDGAWIWLMEIYTAGYSPTTLRYTNNNALGYPNHYYTTWRGSNYWTMPFTIGDISTSTDGKFPTYDIKLGDLDPSGTLRTRIRDTNGLVGSTLRLMVVHSAHLDLTTPAIDELAEILGCDVTMDAVVLTIGIPSLLSRRFPRDKYVPTFCRYKFGGALCQYVQPTDHVITTSALSFHIHEANNSLYVGDVDIVQELFKYSLPLGSSRPNGRWALDKDTGFTVNGTAYNDGFFLADNYYAVAPHYIYVMNEESGGRPFVEESVSTPVTITLGYDACDHTLEACKLRNNTQNYGGSPGIAGGVYG